MFADQILQTALDSLEQYFTILESTGYFNYDLVFRLVLLLMAEEWLNSQLNFYMTEKDYDTISKFVYCLIGNCLIPYPEYMQNIGVVGLPMFNSGRENRLRITEQDLLRHIESMGNLRLTEQRL